MASNRLWNPASPDTLAPPEGGTADFAALAAAPPPAGRGSLVQGDWRASLAAIVLALGWLLYWYRDTALAMEAIWSRSDTFAHGYLVAPIAIWLVWRRREVLRVLPLRPSIFGLMAGLASGLAWLLGQLASVDAVAQFALVGMLISTVWALAGTAVARALAFPLGFLFFCVPFGEFLFPTMMDWTAEFVVGALRLTGIPVYVEGRSLVIPSGHWQVVEGCSGVRYLIASVVVGSLYAYLNYRSLTRRLAFTALAAVVPILANWLRAYGIVLLGHISDNKLATGADHLVYGWVFFGIVMLGLFWGGARWQENFSVPVATGGQTIADTSASRGGAPSGAVFAWWGLALALLSLWAPALSWLEAQGQHGAVHLVAPTPTAGWVRSEAGQVPQWSPRFSGMAAASHSVWSKGALTVGLYLGFYRDQKPGRELINSENRVLMNKDPEWTYVSRGFRPVQLETRTVAVQSTEIKGAPGRLLVWHWFWIGGRLTSDDYEGKLLLALSRFLGRGDDSAVIMVYALEGEGGRGAAEGALQAFAEDMGVSITKAMAITAEQ